jgi:Icc protein
MRVEPERLRSVLGVTNVTYVPGRHTLAIVDSTLSGEMPPMAMGNGGQPGSARRALDVAPNQIAIDNFAFSPTSRTVAAGTEVTWINRDDVPHVIVDTHGAFSSSVLDTNQRYSHRFAAPETYDYFCSIHPKMTGRVVVT